MKTKPFWLIDRGFGLIGLILAVAIVCFMVFFVLKTYVHNPVVDERTQKALSEQGIDASSQRAVLDSTREKMRDINKQILDREKQLENF